MISSGILSPLQKEFPEITFKIVNNKTLLANQKVIPLAIKGLDLFHKMSSGIKEVVMAQIISEIKKVLDINTLSIEPSDTKDTKDTKDTTNISYPVVNTFTIEDSPLKATPVKEFTPMVEEPMEVTTKTEEKPIQKKNFRKREE